jgi:hypothetical protein
LAPDDSRRLEPAVVASQDAEPRAALRLAEAAVVASQDAEPRAALRLAEAAVESRSLAPVFVARPREGPAPWV